MCHLIRFSARVLIRNWCIFSQTQSFGFAMLLVVESISFVIGIEELSYGKDQYRTASNALLLWVIDAESIPEHPRRIIINCIVLIPYCLERFVKYRKGQKIAECLRYISYRTA